MLCVYSGGTGGLGPSSDPNFTSVLPPCYYHYYHPVPPVTLRLSTSIVPIMSFDSTSPLNSADPNARVFSSSCFDFLLIELVPMAERMAKELATEGKDPEDEEVREATFFRLEALGYRVGQGLAER